MGLYRYFADREEILAFVRADAFNRFADALEAAFASGGDAFARARAVGRAYLDFALENPNAYRLMFDLDPPRRRQASRTAPRRQTRRRDHHAACQGSGGGRHRAWRSQLIGHALWAASHGVIVLHLAGRLPRGMDVHDLYFETMRLTFRGARTPSTRAKQPRRSKTLSQS